MALAQGYTLRHPHRGDLKAVTDLLVACDLAITGESDVTEEETEHYWNTPGFVLERDAVVAVDAAGNVAGYEEVQSSGEGLYPVDGYVHPEHRGRDIGAAMLQWAESRVREMRCSAMEPAWLRANIYASETDAAALFEEQGYSHVRRNYRMQIELDKPTPEPVWPEGIAVRSFRPGEDDRVAYEVMRETFEDVWGHVSRPFDEWAAAYIGKPGFDPELWLLVWEGDTPVGAALGSRRAEGGWIRGLGIRRPWRGRGVALALLHHAFNVFRDRGFPFVGLGVDSQSLTGANRLYVRAGMRAIEEYDMFEKVLE